MKDKKGIRYTATTVRILLGLIFFGVGLMYFFMSPEANLGDPTTASGQFMAALYATGYFLPFLKATEVVCGFLLLFFKRFTSLALVILAPIIINIFLSGLIGPFVIFNFIPGVVLGAMAIFLAWYNWHKFAPLFRA